MIDSVPGAREHSCPVARAMRAPSSQGGTDMPEDISKAKAEAAKAAKLAAALSAALNTNAAKLKKAESSATKAKSELSKEADD